MRRLFLILFILIVSSLRCLAQEPGKVYLPLVMSSVQPLRGVRFQAWSCPDAATCGQRLDCLQAAGVNIIYYSIYHEYEYIAYYHSNLLPHRAFDSLAYLVLEAQARGMEVYALMAVGRMGWPQHPEWNLRLNYGLSDGDWLDLTIPAARQFVVDVAMEIVTNYDVDGLLLDYIRWPSVAIMEAELGPEDISLTVQNIYEAVQADAVLAASVYPTRADGAWTGQRWEDWLTANHIDYVTPMAYVEDDELINDVLPDWQASGYFPGRITPRLSVVRWFPSPTPKTVEEVLTQIEICYAAGAEGMTLWCDEAICADPDLVEALKAGGW